jgi:hypothetical protein
MQGDAPTDVINGANATHTATQQSYGSALGQVSKRVDGSASDAAYKREKLAIDRTNAEVGKMNAESRQRVVGNMEADSEVFRKQTNQKIQYDKQWNQYESFAKPTLDIIQGISSLAGIYNGFKALGIAEDQLDLQKERWEETKTEMADIKKRRKKLSESYNSH